MDELETATVVENEQLWRQTGHRIDTAEIVRLISESVLRPGGLQG